jgi:lipopolysaccharide biosynthesis glycosyltransferase
VRGDLTPLFARPLDPGRLGAVRDPMVAVRRAHRGFRRRIDAGWDAAGLPAAARLGYVNSGVLLFHRADLAGFREQVLRDHREHGDGYTHPDQDAVNRALAAAIDHLELEWNYPGFLLDVDVPARHDARVVHFMSHPSPWQGCHWPWGRRGFEPYAGLVREHPGLAPYWDRARGARAARHAAQQLWKSRTEGRTWRSARFRDAVLAVYPTRVATPGEAVRPA